MTDNITDNETIKALECCIKAISDCNNCPYYDDDDCKNGLIGKALDLIHHKDAKIERLEKVRQRQAIFLGEERGQKYELLNKIGKAKSEAIKEFAERLKEYRNDCPMNGKEYICMDIQDIDNLVKEMEVNENDRT